MTYTIAVKPSQTPSKVTATSTNGHTLTTSTPLLDSARYWLDNGANPAHPTPPTHTTTPARSSDPGHHPLRSTIGAAAKLRVGPSTIGRPVFKPANEVAISKDDEI